MEELVGPLSQSLQKATQLNLESEVTNFLNPRQIYLYPHFSGVPGVCHFEDNHPSAGVKSGKRQTGQKFGCSQAQKGSS